MKRTEDQTAAYAARRPANEAPGVDVLRLPILGRLLRWRWSRLVFQVPLLLVAALLVWHGLFGPELAPKNLATLITWVHYRGALVLVLLVAGNLFCFGCPFLVPRELARWLFRPVRNWPRALRNKWLALGLFVLLLFAYELFALWGAPRWTAWLIVTYFAAAVVVDSLFQHAPFCKWVCPIGQFNFIASALSPLEVRARDLSVCAHCKTKDCIRGTPEPSPSPQPRDRLALPVVSQRGCELALFLPMKVGNMDCTFCLDCVHACPHDNVGLVTRLPGEELWAETPRSGVGRLSERRDLAALIVIFTFGALLNAFGMVRPVYALQAWLSQVLGTTQRAPILSLLFVACLVVAPLLLLGPTAWLTRWLTGSRRGLLEIAVRHAYSLVPLGFGVWLAHYAFHFFTGFLTVIPLTQNALAEAGWPVFGEPNWSLSGLREGVVYVMELGFLGLGLIGSWIVAVRLARQEQEASAWRGYLPWVVVHGLLAVAAVWLLSQPMEMRGTFLGG